MANHKSAIKRIRKSEKLRLHNRYYVVTARNAVKKLRATTEKESANEQLLKISSLLDKLAGKRMIHKNKAANLKSKLSLHVKGLN